MRPRLIFKVGSLRPARSTSLQQSAAIGRSHAARSSPGSSVSRTEPDRRERPLLAHFDLALAREFERRGESGRARAPTHMRIAAGLQEKIVKGRPVGLDADQPSQSQARVGERPDVTRFEADARQRMTLGLPRVGCQKVVEVGLVGDPARRA